ncbi:MAG TPA: UDP-N-acetylmuramoyl-L-alanyl-D-glutamate--2,6-diaminopimelate ligase [Kofleriaceae bacterium]|nr:UDP-N-acetylmuramoyl-L-alanyl-D-glutamate--2,6-diaminopimelate ligase [Kofleriaceae bacterium]
MTLADLIQDLSGARLLGAGDPAALAVGEVRSDSRAVEPGDVFVAVPGLRADGHAFAAKAVERGAAALVVERPLDALAGVPQVVVGSAAEALGILTARAAGRPSDRMAMIGVTGTNGKTTTTFLLESILSAAGARPGVIGTVSYRYAGATHPAPYTTPPPAELQRVFGAMAEAATTHVVMEVSSFALSMGRVGGVRYQVAAFTNLTQDHLDVHETMDAYREAKQLLFSHYLVPDGVAVVNADDPASQAMAAAAGSRRVLRVSTRGAARADVAATRFESTIEGIRADLRTPRGEIAIQSHALLGHFNVDNLVMAVAVGEALGLPLDRIAEGIRAMPGVPGRVERVANGAGLDILVDYAHTPDALSNVLGALRPLARRRLICVFGCGGDRDPTKRPVMGAAVSAAADLAVVTSDNPRTEDPRAILEMILPAVPDPFFVDTDRRTAIRAAVAEATTGDVVLIAGKGHEDYQILGHEKIHFDDREEAAAAVALRQGFALEDVLRETGARLVQPGTGSSGFGRVHFDGRRAAPGDLYVAIRGEAHDGHDFCAQAVAAGATGLLIEEAQVERVRAAVGDGPAILAAADTRLAIGAVARFHRRRWGGKLVGVTGSAGKTTTKDLTAAALGAAGRVHRSAASLNNETGVPLSLLGLRPFHDHAVIEMGMRGLGQIAYLAGIAEPDVGVVVNAGVAHVGVVGSVEAIARGKAEIFAGLPPEGCAVLPAGDARLREHAAIAPRRITFGEEDGADVRLAGYRPLAGDTPGSEIELAVARAGGPPAEVTARLSLVGRHIAVDAACAVAAAVALGVDPALAASGLASARPPRMRGEMAVVAGRHLYIDCYNANPVSTAAAMATLAELKGERRGLAVLGDMLELGDESAAAHDQAGRTAARLGLAVIALGDERERVAAGARAGGGAAWAEPDPAAAARRALAESAPGDWILIKGSRGMRLERVVAELQTQGTT